MNSIGLLCFTILLIQLSIAEATEEGGYGILEGTATTGDTNTALINTTTTGDTKTAPINTTTTGDTNTTPINTTTTGGTTAIPLNTTSTTGTSTTGATTGTPSNIIAFRLYYLSLSLCVLLLKRVVWNIMAVVIV